MTPCKAVREALEKDGMIDSIKGCAEIHRKTGFSATTPHEIPGFFQVFQV